MHKNLMTRRAMLAGSAAATWCAAATAVEPAPKSNNDEPPFRFCFNTSTVRGQKLSLPEQVDLAAKAGYSGIEPWVRDVQAYAEGGGSLKDLARRIADAGLTVESAIGFAAWIVDDENQRNEALESARRDMELVRQIGGTRIAAPPVGATREKGLNLLAAAERYAALLRVGEKAGVTPQLEVWGFSANLSRLGEAVFVAVESGREDAAILADVYHLYKGGSPFSGLRMIRGGAMSVFHINDYPDISRDTIKDADRVFPGDGVAPLNRILRDLNEIGFRGALSLELFNPEYWKRDALEVAREGLTKTQSAVERALSS